MTAYLLGPNGFYVLRQADGAIIPPDPENRDYQAFMVWAQTNTPNSVPGPDLYEVAAAARYNAETGGITVGGQLILTDRQSQALINGAVVLCGQNPATEIVFKTYPNAFVTLDAAQITAIGVAVGSHVQACFAREAEVAAEIANGTLITPAAVIARFDDLIGG